ncbi:hypothetical protein K7J14_08030 [Treponema zuelzerae]|uniref:Uncharacterized protein n=1 Tax=Teretinema zuelzerae TaxID=156 RepID=A0AAE3EHQ7_9SPIR|nr:glycosyltransferase [Teretinema zuelzerae]MCD1654652.1 hypothetical protein [Teretinema zuelzerae]
MSRILHRIFFNFDDGPDPFLPYLETWKKELPDFEIKYWDKNNLPINLNQYTANMAAEKNHAFLSDYFRCWLLEKYGGVYLDADIEVLDGNVFRQVYDEAQAASDYSLFIGIESAGNGRLTAHSMGVKDGSSNPILRFMMNLYETSFSGPLRHIIKRFDMPYLMSLYFIENPVNDSAPTNLGVFPSLNSPLTTHGIKIYPAEWFSPVTKRAGLMTITSFNEHTCLCHHFSATWVKCDSGLSVPKILKQALTDKNYAVYPSLINNIRNKYNISDCFLKPRWSIPESGVESLNKIANFLFPFGSHRYLWLKKNDSE